MRGNEWCTYNITGLTLISLINLLWCNPSVHGGLKYYMDCLPHAPYDFGFHVSMSHSQDTWQFSEKNDVKSVDNITPSVIAKQLPLLKSILLIQISLFLIIKGDSSHELWPSVRVSWRTNIHALIYSSFHIEMNIIWSSFLISMAPTNFFIKQYIHVCLNFLRSIWFKQINCKNYYRILLIWSKFRQTNIYFYNKS
jgi:hypothetical protein